MEAKDTVMDDVNIYRGSTPCPVEQVKSLLETQAEISFPLGEVSVAKAVLAIIENPKQVNYRLKEITEYCEAKVDSRKGVVMSKIEATAKVDILEIDGAIVPMNEIEELTVLSHWNHGEWIVIKCGKTNITVDGDDLTEAVEKCQND